MKKLIEYITAVLLFLVKALNKPKQSIQGINKQDIELLTKSFPTFVYTKDMTMEQIALLTARSVGEQRVLAFILARIEGRIGQGVTYD